MAKINLSDLTVVGRYRRYDERIRNHLIDWVNRIQDPLQHKTDSRANFLIWAAPGSGKSFLIQECAASLAQSVEFIELNLAADSKEVFLQGLANIQSGSKPMLVLLDEIDAREGETWPYESTFSLLDLNTKPDRQCVFVLIGSSRSGINGMVGSMVARPKGKDLIDRVPQTNRFEIAALSVGDTISVICTQVLAAAGKKGHRIAEIEKLALFYILKQPGLNTPRQLREFAFQAVQRVSSDETKLRFENLFAIGDRNNQRFWANYVTGNVTDLSESYIKIEG